MPLVQAKCTNCGANLEVDRNKDAAICPYCNTPYVVEKAINNYNTTNNINADVVNIYSANESDFVIRAGALLKYNGSSRDVIIPDGIVSIESYKDEGGHIRGAFEGCKGLKSVTIPDSVTSIGCLAFKECEGLRSVAIPDSVTLIRFGAFEYCNGLVSIALPKSLNEIQNRAFGGCHNLSHVSIASNILKACNAFEYCGSLKNIEYLNGVKIADMSMFACCTNIETITFPDSVEEIINSYTFESYGKKGIRHHVANVKQVIASDDFKSKHNNDIRILTGKVYEKSTGCYVATALYGSYDCPEVWTLRRFRDNELAKTWYGRTFIHTYYAISPTLVKWFGHTEWFKHMWKPKLDRLVANLKAQGVEDTYYEDKNW